MRDELPIAQDRIRACLQAAYGVTPATIEYLPLGWDTSAGVYRVVDAQGAAYLLKATMRPLYEPSYQLPHYLHDQGIASVVAPLPTLSADALSTQLDGWRLALYPFVAGETGWASITDDHWRTTGAIFRRIHAAPLPTVGAVSLQRETFDPSGYAQWIRAFDAQSALTPGGDAAAALRAAWRANQRTIDAVVVALETLAGALRGHSLAYVICHADLHPGNLIRDQDGGVHVIDWDEVMLAPKERDFLFVGDPPAENDSADATAPFFQGYGPTEIDWTALTYFRYERVAQDVISYAEEASLRDDLGEATKAAALAQFQINLSDEGYLAVARRAAARLPAALATELAARIGVDGG